MDLGTAIIGIINLIGFFLYFIVALFTSWEGLGLVVLALILYTSKDKLYTIWNTNSLIYYSGIFYLIWLGIGNLIGVSNSIIANIFGKTIALFGVIFIFSVFFFIKKLLMDNKGT